MRKPGSSKFTNVSNITSWNELGEEFETSQGKRSDYTTNEDFNRKLALWQGDMTKLEIDAIVNAANESLLGGGGIDGAIHRAAGRELVKECRTLKGCETGNAKITAGYDLPAKHVIHTVGPIGENSDALKSCYKRCMEVLVENGLRTICFCCVSTGIYGYPPSKAAVVALQTVRSWLEEEDNKDKVDKIVFCTFLDNDFAIYRKLLPYFFPVGRTMESDEQKLQESDDKLALNVGETVVANFLGMEGRRGRIVKVNKDNSVDIEYENGAKEVKVGRKRIEQLPNQQNPDEDINMKEEATDDQNMGAKGNKEESKNGQDMKT